MNPELSAILVVGKMRARGQRVLDALSRQTAQERMEIVLVDMAAGEFAPLVPGPGARTTQVAAAHARTYVRARIEGLEAARSDVVAFIEDHCFPDAGWAEAVIEAHRGSWAAVGYALVNANPEAYVARASMISDYGAWTHPIATREARSLPSHNISYKRRVLEQQGERLEILLAPDQVMLEVLRRRGERFFVAGEALARHENFTRVAPLLQTNYAYARLYTGHRVRAHAIGGARRLAHALLAVSVGPANRLIQLARGLRGRGLWRQTAVAAPVLLASYAAGAIGASVGYLLGPGGAEEDLTYFDFAIDKIG